MHWEWYEMLGFIYLGYRFRDQIEWVFDCLLDMFVVVWSMFFNHKD